MRTSGRDRGTNLVDAFAAGAGTHVRIAGTEDADRALLRALDRVGVSGTTALAALMAAQDLVARLRDLDSPGPVDLDVVADTDFVHIDLDITTRTDAPAALIAFTSSLAQFAITPHAAAASRWGMIREPAHSTVWVEVDRVTPTVGPTTPGGIDDAGIDVTDLVSGPVSDPARLLLDVTARLARAHSMRDIGEVVAGPLRAHLGASTARLALREDAVDGLSTPRLFPNAAAADRELPGLGASLRAAGKQAMASLPLRIDNHVVGALVVAWTGARPVQDLEPLLTVVASHTAEAISRTTARPARPPGTPATPTDAGVPVQHDRFRFDLVTRSVARAGRPEPVRLTGREFELLLHLVQHAGTVVSRAAILREVWGIDFRADTSVVDVTVFRVRRKLGSDAILTVRDQGYTVRT